ncbi:DUF3631 domain-containing protein [Gemmatimonadota bacterium]
MSAGAVASLDDLVTALGLESLGSDAPMDAVLSTVEKIREWRRNGASPEEVALVGTAARKAWRVAGADRPGELWDATKPSAPEGEKRQGRSLDLADPEPWPAKVDGAELLPELVRTFARFLALPEGGPTALALWVLHAHAHDAAEISPFLAITSPQKRCGKTVTLEVLGALTPRPLPAANITKAVVYRAVERWRPTLLVDEADSFLSGSDELRGILNSAYRRRSAFVPRCEGDNHEPRMFCTWCPLAIALIGKLQSTLDDRAIEIRMRRRRPGETVERLRLDRLSELEPLKRKAWTWAQANLEELRTADPGIPQGLHDRAADNWRPLLAIADQVGGPWPERARRAAALFSGQAEDDEVGTLLLEDLRRIFQEQNRDRLTSREITDALVKMEDRPWPEWRRGQPLTTRALARILKPYEIGPKGLRWDEEGHKPGTRGYVRADFSEAWERYLPPLDPPAQPAQVQQVQQANNDGPSGGFHKCNESPHVADTKTPETAIDTGVVADVADGEGDSGGEGTPKASRRFSETTADLFEVAKP